MLSGLNKYIKITGGIGISILIIFALYFGFTRRINKFQNIPSETTTTTAPVAGSQTTTTTAPVAGSQTTTTTAPVAGSQTTTTTAAGSQTTTTTAAGSQMTTTTAPVAGSQTTTTLANIPATTLASTPTTTPANIPTTTKSSPVEFSELLKFLAQPQKPPGFYYDKDPDILVSNGLYSLYIQPPSK